MDKPIIFGFGLGLGLGVDQTFDNLLFSYQFHVYFNVSSNHSLSAQDKYDASPFIPF